MWSRHFWVTAWETLAGFAVAAVFGIALAYLIVHYRRLNRILYPYVLAAQLVPKVAVAPLFFIWFGFGELPKILVRFLVAFFPIVVDTIVGLHAADPDMLDFMRTLRASTYRTFLRVKLPAALPHIFGSFKVAVTLAVIGAVIGEFVGAESGLGYMIIRAQSHFRTDQVFASLFLLAVLGMILFMGFALVERLAIPWYARMKRVQSGVVLAAVLCAVAFPWSPTSVGAETAENVNFALDCSMAHSSGSRLPGRPVGR